MSALYRQSVFVLFCQIMRKFIFLFFLFCLFGCESAEKIAKKNQEAIEIERKEAEKKEKQSTAIKNLVSENYKDFAIIGTDGLCDTDVKCYVHIRNKTQNRVILIALIEMIETETDTKYVVAIPVSDTQKVQDDVKRIARFLSVEEEKQEMEQEETHSNPSY